MFYIARQNDRENGSKIDRKIASFRIFGTRNDDKKRCCNNKRNEVESIF